MGSHLGKAQAKVPETGKDLQNRKDRSQTQNHRKVMTERRECSHCTYKSIDSRTDWPRVLYVWRGLAGSVCIDILALACAISKLEQIDPICEVEFCSEEVSGLEAAF